MIKYFVCCRLQLVACTSTLITILIIMNIILDKILCLLQHAAHLRARNAELHWPHFHFAGNWWRIFNGDRGQLAKHRKINISINPLRYRVAQIAASWHPGCENTEREWGNIERFTLYISSLFPPSLSISYVKICHILSQNLKYGILSQKLNIQASRK